MKVLIAATACHPTAGSEAYVGWQAVSLLRREHELCVLTSLWCREGIERTVNTEEGWERVRFVYVDEKRAQASCHPNRMIARIQSWLGYRLWCGDAGKIARQLVVQERFDLAHHVTYATWRMGSPLAGLGVPWIWGPIGGGEVFPWRLIEILSPVAALFEIIRAINSWISRRSGSVRDAIASASLVLPNNHETERLVLKLGVPKERIRRLCQSFLPGKRLERLGRTEWITPRECGELLCVAGGNLEGRKGVAIALRALAELSRRGVPFRYTYLGRGPEMEHLKGLARRLGIEERVCFLDSLSGVEYIQALQSSHVYLLPSLREGVPVTQMEAMAAGCVPVVAACGGAGPMAKAAGLQSITLGPADHMAKSIAMVLAGYWQDGESWREASEASSAAIGREYSDEHYAAEMNVLYGRVAGFRPLGR